MQSADEALRVAEGHGLERLVGRLYEERSRKGLGDFPLTRMIDGYWDRAGTEIDLVAVNDEDEVIRFGTCKRSPQRLVPDLTRFDGHIERFLAAHKRYQDWTIDKVAIAPSLDGELRARIGELGYLPQDLVDLTEGL